MRKNIKLSTSSIIFFILNIIILISSVVLRNIYINIGYDLKIINIIFILNIIILLLCISFNIYLLIYDNIKLKKVIFLVLSIVVAYSFINIFLTSYVNKKCNEEYFKITEKLTNYCKEFYCSKYETISLKDKRKFRLEKKYTDYNNETQLIEISIIYGKELIKEIDAIIYSSNESYSTFLIKEQLSLYFSNFNIELDEESINSAFEKRDEGNIKFENQIYEVKSIYNKEILDGFKTKIKISL